MSLAFYKWSSMVTRFSVLTSTNRRTPIEILSQLAAERCPWETEMDFKTSVSYCHELVHYYQDFLTGMGHWDYLRYKEIMPGSFTWAKQLLRVSQEFPFSTSKPAYEQDAIYRSYYDYFQAHYDGAAAGFINAGHNPDSVSLWKKTFEEYVAANFPEGSSIADSEGFRVESLLEGEAVATVYRTFINILQTPEQIAIFNKFDFLVLPQKMAGVYTETISLFYTFLFPDENNEENELVHFNFSLRLLVFFVDLASAYPPPAMLEHSGIANMEYEPGIKFLRLALALKDLDRQEGKAFANAINERNAEAAEQILLKRCIVPYPTTKVIYEAWAGKFNTLLAADDDTLLKLRYNACMNRVKGISNGLIDKTPAQLLFQNKDIPINFLTATRHFTAYLMDLQAIDEDFRNLLYVDVLRWNRDLRLYEMFYKTGIFICPLAEAGGCSAASDTCFSIKRFTEFPEQGCVMRESVNVFN